jgi:hypothetical protein
MKRHGKPSRAQSHDKEACEVHLVQILRIKKQIGNAQIRTKSSGHHREENDPAQQEYMVTLEVIQQQLNGKRISNDRKKGLDPAHQDNISKVTLFIDVPERG